MKVLTTLAVASALAVSYAAPVLAATVEFESKTLVERNVYTNPSLAQPINTNNWMSAYAKATPKSWQHTADMNGPYAKDFAKSFQ